MAEKVLTRTLFSTSNCKVMSYLHMPYETYYVSSITGRINVSLNAHPMLFITYEDSEFSKGRSFTMTPKNRVRVMKFFNKVKDWYEDPNMSNMFYFTEDDKLLFNHDYDNLEASVFSGKKFNQTMKASPAVITNDDGENVEAVALTINTSESTAYIQWSDYESLVDILSRFDFDRESEYLCMLYEMCRQEKQFKTNEQARIERQLNAFPPK